jgi:protocatechuate 3,4-dioxygenase beta subunit
MRAALLIALSAVTLLHAEQGQTPPRDSSRPAAPGVSRIRGRVLAADTGQPLGRAQVSITAPSITMRSTLTDADGRYEFADVPAGAFGLTASKTGYVSLEYGQRRPFEPGRPVTVGAGQTVDRVDVTLPRGAVIAARITDDLGSPLAGVEVRVHRQQYRSDGQRVSAQIAGAIRGPDLTDDRGEVRIFGLMPGEYLLSAVSRYLPSVGANPSGGDGYVTTFYPGVLHVSQATPISVAVGQEVPAPLSLIKSRLALVIGVVLDPQGRPANGARVTLATTSPGSSGSALAGVDGRFAIGNIAPGDYALAVIYDTFEGWPAPVTVAGADISDLRLVAGGGTTISGRIVFEGGVPPVPRPASFRAVVLSATALPLPGLPVQRTMAPEDDGRFGVTGINGPVIISSNAPPGWVVKSVIAEGRDVTDDVIDLAGRATLSDVTITLTNRLTSLTGQVTDARSQPVQDCVVVIVPVDVYHPRAMGRHVRALRPGPSGTFTTQGMKPGRYVAVAVEALPDERGYSPEFQQQVRRVGQEFTLDEGQTRSLNLRLTPDL